MGSSWKKIVLGDLLTSGDALLQTGPFGTALKAEEYTETGVPLISVREIREGVIEIESKTPRVDSTVTQRLPKFVLKSGDIIFARKGGIERNALITEREHGWFVGSDGIYLRLSDKYCSEYYSYVMRSPKVKKWLLKNCEGTTMPSLNQKILSRIPIFEPPLIEQRKVAKVLRAFDKKISLNNQINQTLEQMAQTLFKSWFVDFDPVIDNALDAGYPIPEVFETRVECRKAVRESADFKPLPDDVRELFPSEFEESELGWVPKGWGKGSLAEQVALIGGGTPKRSNEEFWGGQIPWFSVKDAPSSSDVFVIDTDEKITELGLNGSSTKLLPLGTTIISARGTVGKLALVGCEMAMNQSCYGVQPKDQKSFSFNYFNLKHAIKTLQQNTHGAVFDTITKNTFDTVEAVIPPQIVLDAFESYSTVWLEKIKSNLTTSASLTKLRETLLPKLISGELRLDSPEVEQAKALVE
ncbi:restriction endonuclease subunit S [Vibrio hyugaensis]|uniref:restriction endonuclease subunit S n=1 Tax=Vibrio hyugaensis TaxID=1534743 RepID=UPI003DA07E7B